MKTFWVLTRTRILSFKKIFVEKDWAKIFVFFGFSFILTAAAAGSFFLFLEFFRYLATFGEFGFPIVRYTLAATFLILLVFMIGGFIIECLSFLFQGSILPLYFSSPVLVREIFAAQFVLLVSFGAWPMLCFGLPILFAYGLAYALSFPFYVLTILVVFFMILATASFSSICTIILANLFGKQTGRLKYLLVILGIVAVAYLLVYMLLPGKLFGPYDSYDITSIIQQIKKLPVLSPFLPSAWAVQIVLEQSMGHLLALFLLTIALFFLAFVLADQSYLFAWLRSQEGVFIAGPQDKTVIVTRGTFPKLLTGILGSFFERELLYLVRKPAEAIQGSFVFLMSAVYIFVISKIHFVKIAPPIWFSWILSFSFGILGYILTTLGIRYAFPTFSQERKSAWASFVTPVSRKGIFWAKLVFFATAITLVAEILGLISSSLLKLNSETLVGLQISLLLVSLGVTVVTLGLGTAFPNFHEETSEAASTSLAGIMATLICLFYVFAVSLFLRPLFFHFTLESFALCISKTLILTLILFVFFSRLALRRLERMDF